VLANLVNLTVTALSDSTVTVNTGVAPPTGGGFEIRLRDYAFQPGEDPTLVLRGSEQNLTFSRVSASDRFYIRMYDGSTPPATRSFPRRCSSICRERMSVNRGSWLVSRERSAAGVVDPRLTNHGSRNMTRSAVDAHDE